MLSVGGFMGAWLKDNQALAIVVVLCVTLLIGLAMYFGLDLSWIPDIMRRFFV